MPLHPCAHRSVIHFNLCVAKVTSPSGDFTWAASALGGEAAEDGQRGLELDVPLLSPTESPGTAAVVPCCPWCRGQAVRPHGDWGGQAVVADSPRTRPPCAPVNPRTTRGRQQSKSLWPVVLRSCRGKEKPGQHGSHPPDPPRLLPLSYSPPGHLRHPLSCHLQRPATGPPRRQLWSAWQHLRGRETNGLARGTTPPGGTRGAQGAG